MSRKVRQIANFDWICKFETDSHLSKTGKNTLQGELHATVRDSKYSPHCTYLCTHVQEVFSTIHYTGLPISVLVQLLPKHFNRLINGAVKYVPFIILITQRCEH